MTERTVRASEVAEYTFCQRAWWYARVDSVPLTDVEPLAAGQQWHRRKSRGVLSGLVLQILGYALLLVTVVMAMLYLADTWMG